MPDADTPVLRAACLGGGVGSAVGRSHQIAMRMDRRFEVVAACFALQPEENAASAREYGVDPSRLYGSLDELLARGVDDVDVVVILTPTDQHAAQVRQVLEAGIPVICEKALAVSVEEAREIKTTVEARGGYLGVIYNYLGYPMLRELRAMVQAGTFGRLEQIHVEMPQEGFLKKTAAGEPMTPQAWRLRDHAIPTVSLDLGVHTHSLVAFLSGQPPVEVTAVSSRLGNFAEVEDNVVALIRYADGMICNMWFGKTAIGYRNGLKIRVFGERASAEWVQEDPESLAFADCFGNRRRIDRASPGMLVAQQDRYNRFKAGHPAGFLEAFANYYYDLADAITDHKRGAGPSASGYAYGVDFALEGLALLQAAEVSSARSEWMRL